MTESVWRSTRQKFKFDNFLARRNPRKTCREETRDLEKRKPARS